MLIHNTVASEELLVSGIIRRQLRPNDNKRPLLVNTRRDRRRTVEHNMWIRISRPDGLQIPPRVRRRIYASPTKTNVGIWLLSGKT